MMRNIFVENPGLEFRPIKASWSFWKSYQGQDKHCLESLELFHPCFSVLVCSLVSDISPEERWIFMRCQPANRLESCSHNGSQEMRALISQNSRVGNGDKLFIMLTVHIVHNIILILLLLKVAKKCKGGSQGHRVSHRVTGKLFSKVKEYIESIYLYTCTLTDCTPVH